MRLIDADYILSALGVFTSEEPKSAHFMNGIRTAREIVEDAPTVGGWISVEDKMPEEGTWVLVCEKDGFMFIDVRDDGKWRIGVQALAVITHWMPLPEPPKGGDGDEPD